MSGVPTLAAVPTVNAARLLRMIDELAQIGADASGGVSRLGFTPEEDAARAYLADVAREAGFNARVDEAGNLIVRMSAKPTRRPALLIGSHIDSVARGGRLDGAYGVVAGLEALMTLAEHSVGDCCEPVLAAFANEEGALFPCPFWGSLAMAGRTPEMSDCFREALARAGGDPRHVQRAAWPADDVAAYLELHIEQGPVLERMQTPIGVVDGIVGRTIFEIGVQGKQNHAGTTPMDARTDALVVASRLVLAIDALSRRYGLCSVSTTGRLDIEPGMVNVVPGKVTLSAEIRDARPENLARAEAAVLAALRDAEASSGARVEVTVTMRAEPVPTDPALRAVIAAAADSLGLPHLTLPSGAGHDAQIIASLAPVGMIFVPSQDGISHSPAESTTAEDLINGANVLTAAASALISGRDE
jgi:beta-ureidopropionase / N-carbamoyl-L-amino-acid hydrolase